MNKFFYVFVACVILLIIGLLITLIVSKHKKEGRESYVDDDGLHRYYDRSIIEKNKFHKENPEIEENDIRSFRRLINFIRGKDISD